MADFTGMLVYFIHSDLSNQTYCLYYWVESNRLSLKCTFRRLLDFLHADSTPEYVITTQYTSKYVLKLVHYKHLTEIPTASYDVQADFYSVGQTD